MKGFKKCELMIKRKNSKALLQSFHIFYASLYSYRWFVSIWLCVGINEWSLFYNLSTKTFSKIPVI